MQLKIQRSQRMGGVLGNTVLFCLDVRADYSPDEQHNIRRYRLGGQLIYSSQAARRHMETANAHLDRTQSRDLKEQFGGLAHGAFSMALAKMSLNISIASLGHGHHIECKDLDELLQAEDTVRTACKDVTRYLEVAATFDGSEMVIEYDKGEEQIHITQNAPPLIEYRPQANQPSSGVAPSSRLTGALGEASPPPRTEPLLEDLGKTLAKAKAAIKARWHTMTPKAVALWQSRERTAHNLKTHAVRFGEAVKARWLAIETKIAHFAEKNGWSATGVQIRALCGGVAVVVLLAAVISYEFF